MRSHKATTALVRCGERSGARETRRRVLRMCDGAQCSVVDGVARTNVPGPNHAESRLVRIEEKAAPYVNDGSLRMIITGVVLLVSASAALKEVTRGPNLASLGVPKFP